ncbi:hypothetical protein ACOME3_007876 [Neoechinorhynchus agilis]
MTSTVIALNQGLYKSLIQCLSDLSSPGGTSQSKVLNSCERKLLAMSATNGFGLCLLKISFGDCSDLTGSPRPPPPEIQKLALILLNKYIFRHFRVFAEDDAYLNEIKRLLLEYYFEMDRDPDIASWNDTHVARLIVTVFRVDATRGKGKWNELTDRMTSAVQLKDTYRVLVLMFEFLDPMDSNVLEAPKIPESSETEKAHVINKFLPLIQASLFPTLDDELFCENINTRDIMLKIHTRLLDLLDRFSLKSDDIKSNEHLRLIFCFAWMSLNRFMGAFKSNDLPSHVQSCTDRYIKLVSKIVHEDSSRMDWIYDTGMSKEDIISTLVKAMIFPEGSSQYDDLVDYLMNDEDQYKYTTRGYAFYIMSIVFDRFGNVILDTLGDVISHLTESMAKIPFSILETCMYALDSFGVHICDNLALVNSCSSENHGLRFSLKGNFSLSMAMEKLLIQSLEYESTSQGLIIHGRCLLFCSSILLCLNDNCIRIHLERLLEGLLTSGSHHSSFYFFTVLTALYENCKFAMERLNVLRCKDRLTLACAHDAGFPKMLKLLFEALIDTSVLIFYPSSHEQKTIKFVTIYIKSIRLMINLSDAYSELNPSSYAPFLAIDSAVVFEFSMNMLRHSSLSVFHRHGECMVELYVVIELAFKACLKLENGVQNLPHLFPIISEYCE